MPSSSPSPERTLAIIDALALSYHGCGVGIWLFGRHKQLDGERPIDLLRAGRFDEVEALVPDPGMVAT
jgi:hypothetical protein